MKKLLSLTLSTLLVLTPMTAFANSAQTQFQGVSPTGTMITGEQSPILVEKETLTFELQEFPLEYYAEEAEYLAYTGKVTAEYTFHNPADYDVTAKLAFPFGQAPDYGYAFAAVDAEKYDVLLDGAPIERTVRHTLFYRGEEFALEKDLPNLIDGYMEDAFWKFDLPVTKYTWEISGIDEEFDAARLGFWWDGDPAERKLMLMNQSGGNHSEDKIAVTRWVENGDKIVLYVFGKPLEENLEWFSENGSEDTPFVYTLTFLGEETGTYEDYVFAEWEDTSTVLRHDWYNAMTQCLKKSEWDFGILGSFEFNGNLRADDLLRWYEYEISIPAGGTVVNMVTAPMYPDANVRYEPPIYTYNYLLSPAKTWADFGNLDIIVNTPYYMTESGGDFSFEKTETGYQTSLDGLPEGELTFTLSADAEPKASGGMKDFFMIGIAVVGTLVYGGLQVLKVICIAVIIVIAVFVWRKRKKRKQDK